MRTPSPEPPPVWLAYERARRERFQRGYQFRVGDRVLYHALAHGDDDHLDWVQVHGVVRYVHHLYGTYTIEVDDHRLNTHGSRLEPDEPAQPALFEAVTQSGDPL